MPQESHASSGSQGKEQRAATRAERPEATHASPALGAESPPLVSRGANSQGPIVDYLRFTGPVDKLDAIRSILRDSFGDLIEGGPGGPYTRSLKVGTSSGVFWGSHLDNLKDRLKVELSGSMLVDIELPQIIELVRSFVQAGLSATRIDVAVDFFSEPNLIDQVVEGAKSGQLVRARTFKHHVGGQGGTRNNHGVEVGKRGKDGSGRYVRIYDKGLETKTMTEGKWIRWEVEFATGHAGYITYHLSNTKSNEEAAAFLLETVFGAIDFKEPTDKHVSRRPRSLWYQRLIGTISPSLLRVQRHRTDLAGYKSWIRTAVLPKLEKYSDELGITIVELMDYLGAGRPSAPSRVLQSDVFRQLESEWSQVN